MDDIASYKNEEHCESELWQIKYGGIDVRINYDRLLLSYLLTTSDVFGSI